VIFSYNGFFCFERPVIYFSFQSVIKYMWKVNEKFIYGWTGRGTIMAELTKKYRKGIAV